jgi:hypothetical protein
MDILTDYFSNFNFFINPCAGENAYQTLAKVFSSRVKACQAGTIINLNN